MTDPFLFAEALGKASMLCGFFPALLGLGLGWWYREKKMGCKPRAEVIAFPGQVEKERAA